MVLADRPWQVANWSGGIEPLLSLISAIGNVSSVEQIRYDLSSGILELWVLVNREDFRRIALLDRDYRRAPEAYPLAVHVLPVSEVDVSMLADLSILRRG